MREFLDPSRGYLIEKKIYVRINLGCFVMVYWLDPEVEEASLAEGVKNVVTDWW